jgi:hypothetical protein
MRLTRATMILMLVGIFGLLLAGCGTDSTSVESNGIEELNLTDDFGGYKAVDQPPAFGDPEIENTMAADAESPTMDADSIDVDSLRCDPQNTLYSVIIRWGQLDGDSTVTAATDWSGTASVLYGHLGVFRLIRFEPGQDYIVRPRVNRLEVSWVSQTTVHYDGLVFVIADPVDPDDTLPAENTFTFATAPYTETFPVTDLADLDTIITVDDLGNQVSITAHKLEALPCGQGFVEGVWRANNHLGKMGKFFGKWMSDDGALLGHIRGHWGERGNGERVLFGQWISLAGIFKGFIRGTYDPDPAQPGQGTFDTKIYTRNKVEIGVLTGEYLKSDDIRRGGYFQGMWEIDCADDGDTP